MGIYDLSSCRLYEVDCEDVSFICECVGSESVVEYVSFICVGGVVGRVCVLVE